MESGVEEVMEWCGIVLRIVCGIVLRIVCGIVLRIVCGIAMVWFGIAWYGLVEILKLHVCSGRLSVGSGRLYLVLKRMVCRSLGKIHAVEEAESGTDGSSPSLVHVKLLPSHFCEKWDGNTILSGSGTCQTIAVSLFVKGSAYCAKPVLCNMSYCTKPFLFLTTVFTSCCDSLFSHAALLLLRTKTSAMLELKASLWEVRAKEKG